MIRKLWKILRLSVVFPLISLLPLPLAYRLGALAYRYDPVLRKQTRVAVAQGMQRLLPEANEISRLRKLVDAYQDMLGRELLDVYFYPRLSTGNISRLVDIEGLENITKPRADKRGRILAFAHYGRPSLALIAMSLAGAKIHVITQAIDHTNPGLDGIDRGFLRFKVWGNLRHLTGRWIPLNSNPRFLYERLAAGETVMILFDVCPSGGPTIDMPFFGMQMRLPQGITRLLAKTDSRLYFGRIRDVGWRAHLSIEEIDAENPAAAFAQAIGRLEADVGAAPSQWWQWHILDYLLVPSDTP